MPPQAYTKEVLATAFDWLSRQTESVKKSIRTSDDLVGLYLKSTRLKEGQEASTQVGGYSSDLSSAKSFRSELQGLALNLKQFEDKPAEPPQKSEPTSEYLHELSLMMSTQNQSQQHAPPRSNNRETMPAQHSSSQQGSNTQTSQSSNQQMSHQAPNHSQQQSAQSMTQMMHNPSSQQAPHTMNRFTPQNPQTFDEPPMTAIKETNSGPIPADSAETVLLKLDKKTISAINLAKERLNLSSNTEAIRVLVSLGEKHLKKIFGTEE